MKIVDYEPQAWFLVQDERGTYLSVRCQQSFVEFETLIQLNADEWREYHALGHVYIEYLAARVSYWASEYQSRNLSQSLGSQVHQAVMEWKAVRGNEGIKKELFDAKRLEVAGGDFFAVAHGVDTPEVRSRR